MSVAQFALPEALHCIIRPAPTCHLQNLQGYLTKEQELELREMRAAFPQSAAFHTDHDLLRFLRAREFNRKATWAMYNHYSGMVSLPSLCLELWVRVTR